MIDFRYHLVSLVAVFLALAVGVVLGAGPLRGQLSDTLEGQVAELGNERNALRSQLGHQQDLAEDRDTVLADATTRAVTGALTGVDVSLVVLPGADPELADDLTAVLATGGAGVAGRTSVLGVFDDPAADEVRRQALAGVAPLLGEASAEADLADAVTAAVVGTGVGGAPVEADALGSRLQQAEVIEVSDTREGSGPVLPGAVDLAPPDLVVVVTGGVAPGDADDPETANRLQRRVELVQALVGSAVPVLVVGTGAETWREGDTTEEDPLVALIRADDQLAGELATVDNAESGTGRVTAAWTAARAVAREMGHYGAAADADGAAPSAPPVEQPPDRPFDQQPGR